MGKQSRPVHCLILDKVIPNAECKVDPIDPRCIICGAGNKGAVFVCGIDDYDNAFHELIIKRLLHDKEVVDALLNLPDKELHKRRVMGLPSDQVSDEEFFELIRRDPEYLGSRFALEKIQHWQETHREEHSGAAKARDNLEKIGLTLAQKGETEQFREKSLVAFYRDRIYSQLKINLKDLPKEQWEECLQELFGRDLLAQLDSNGEIVELSAISELADALTAITFGLEKGTVKQYQKFTRTKTLSTGKKVFFAKTPPKKKPSNTNG